MNARPIRPTPRSLIRPLCAGIALSLSLTATAEEWPAQIQQLEQQGLTIHGEFDVPGGLQGYAASTRGQTVAAYLTPDNAHAVIGTLIDAEGQDIAAEKVEQLVNGPRNAQLWQQMADHHWVRDGDAEAPRVVYTFSDPNCPFCRQFWADAQPWIESGDVQVRHLVVGMLKADSPEKAAAILAADEPDAALAEHYRNGSLPTTDGNAQSSQWVSDNTQLMRSGQLHATPATFYQDEEGKVHRIMGAPTPDKLRAIMGGKAP